MVSLGANVAVAAVTQATVIQQHEPMIAGAAQSLMLAAIVGSLIGVYLHQGRNKTAPLLPIDGTGWRAAAGLAWRVVSWGVGVAGFAFIAAASHSIRSPLDQTARLPKTTVSVNSVE